MEEVNHWVKVENGSDVSIRDSFKENEYLFSAEVWSPEFTFSRVSNPKTTTRDGGADSQNDSQRRGTDWD